MKLPFMNWERAIVCGVLGGWLAALLMGAASLAGWSGTTALLLGQRLSTPPVSEQYVLGVVLQTLVAMFWGMVYASIFERVLRGAGAGRGGALGLAHGLLTALLLTGVLGRQVHPEGLSGWSTALQSLVIVVVSVLFGMVMGAGYGPVAVRSATLKA